jgi:cell division protein FtsA
MAATILDRQVRVGRPSSLRGLPEQAAGPAFATSVGLLSWAGGEGRSVMDIDIDQDRPGGLLRRIVNFLRDRT